jgi:predicted transcriptional regulator
MELTKSELEIMNVLWRADRPLSRSDILALSTEKSWKDNSIHILLNGMLKKEAIVEAGFTRSGKVWGRLYAPNVSIDEYYNENLFSQTSQKEFPLLFSAMVNREDITTDMIDELESILQKRRQELS